jgi:DNA-binding MarR family transcriptional regulator
VGLGAIHNSWQIRRMARDVVTDEQGMETQADPALAPITDMLSSRLIVLANLLRRGALLRYQRLTGLSSVEFGLVASLGRNPPMSVARLAAAVGMDKGQISRALSELVRRRLVTKAVNARDSREVLVSLTKSGLVAHDRIVAGATERQQRLLAVMDTDRLQRLRDDVDRLTAIAAQMLEEERGLGG